MSLDDVYKEMIDAEYRQLIESDRVSDVTRAVLLERVRPDDAEYKPKAISAGKLTVLRALLARVVPQGFGAASSSSGQLIDIAARLDKQLATGKGDGWRYASLPADAEAYRLGLGELDALAETAHGKPFAGLGPDKQDEMLAGIADGSVKSERLDMMRWFEEVRGNAVEVYVSHPATLARLGYSGIADGGDSATMRGFQQIRIGEVEPWEPKPAARSTTASAAK